MKLPAASYQLPAKTTATAKHKAFVRLWRTQCDTVRIGPDPPIAAGYMKRPAYAGLFRVWLSLVVVVVAYRDHRVRRSINEHKSAHADGGAGCRRGPQICAVGERHRDRGRAAQRAKR